MDENSDIIKEKIVDLDKSVYEICTKYPDVLDVMYDMGFKEIKIPGMLATAGRVMKIPAGAKMKNIDMEELKNKLKGLGYQIKEE